MPKDGKFRKPSFSNIDPVPYCVTVARTGDGHVLVKHSQAPESAEPQEYTEAEWKAFTDGVKAGEFDI
ncbi:MAG: DUF397 domain-containing protein [Patescibacteria group bacterium]|nr:DUF397 domain-containing protein [Patescibacteria group bacterium]